MERSVVFDGGPSVPPNFKTIKEIDQFDNDRIKKGDFVSVVGLITDFQAPMKTMGEDWKCTPKIKDHSCGDHLQEMSITIFWPENIMPMVVESDSVVLVRNGKVQMYRGNVSLLANKQATEFHIISSSKLIGENASAWPVWTAYSAKKQTNPPNAVELAYAKWLTNQRSELGLPSSGEFRTKVAQSINTKEKFSLLKDVKPSCFYDILGQVVKIHEEVNRPLTVYLSDYTANTNFYNYVWDGGPEESNSRDGDVHGYIKSVKKEGSGWPGPYGKLTIQLNLWDWHASFVTKFVKPHDWVMLKNVKIDFDRRGGLLEGYLRGDQRAFAEKVQVTVMKQSDNPEENDPRWKDAVRRRQECWARFKMQKQEILDEAAGLPSKRKLGQEEGLKGNSKERRKLKRAKLDKKLADSESRVAAALDLNQNIKCYYADRAILPIAEILKPEILSKKDGQEYHSPFTLRKYRANVRVLDYFPDQIEDFAVGRRSSDMDILSDYSGGEETDLEEDRMKWKSGKGFPKDIWEWRFELLVEDADPCGSKDRVWLTVDNLAAQGLLAMEEDATSLRGNPDLLATLKEQLFKLWGDLEERKAAMLELGKTRSKQKRVSPSSTFGSIPSSPPATKAGAQPDVDSDVENEVPRYALSNKSKKSALTELNKTHSGPQENVATTSEIVPNNKAFTCCIKQYGIMIDEADPAKADAGEGKRWQRKFGIFDTFIS